MMEPITILKLVYGDPLTEVEVQDMFFEICYRTSECTSECPVFRMNGNKIPFKDEDEDCCCHHDGAAMYQFLINKFRIVK